jgi:hypothetical protein
MPEHVALFVDGSVCRATDDPIATAAAAARLLSKIAPLAECDQDVAVMLDSSQKQVRSGSRVL